ncbi:MAG: TIGR02281 family clan AA aspartic protease [Phenylobacterium sp.]
MSEPRGPWDLPEPEPSPAPGRRGRPIFWIGLAVGLSALVWGLAKTFPEAARSNDDWAWIAQGVLVVVIVAAGAARSLRPSLGQGLRLAAMWAVIVGALALGVAYRDEISGVPQHLRLAFGTGYPVATGDHELVIPQQADGGFLVNGEVNGQHVSFLLDTGATDTVLSPQDARRLGVDVDRLRYDYGAETANGTGYGAAYVAQRLAVGPIAFDDFRMTVNQAPMSRSLLGLSFLNRLSSFEIRDRKLILKWREAGAATRS